MVKKVQAHRRSKRPNNRWNGKLNKDMQIKNLTELQGRDRSEQENENGEHYMETKKAEEEEDEKKEDEKEDEEEVCVIHIFHYKV